MSVPKSMAREDVAMWLAESACSCCVAVSHHATESNRWQADAVLALVEAKVREVQRLTLTDIADRNGGFDVLDLDADIRSEVEAAHESIVKRVIGGTR